MSPPWIIALGIACLIVAAVLAYTFVTPTVLASHAIVLTLIAIPFVLFGGFVIAAICGAVGKAIAGGGPGGLITSTALGFIGALFGPWIAAQLNLSEPFVLRMSGQSFPILWSIIGAALFVALLHLVSGQQSDFELLPRVAQLHFGFVAFANRLVELP